MDNKSLVPDEDIAAVLKGGVEEIADKKLMFHAIQQATDALSLLPLESLEENFIFLLPSLRNLFTEIYDENSAINSKEHVDLLIENLVIAVGLTDIIGKIINVSSKLEISTMSSIKGLFQEVPSCFYLTYKHCKESQKRYQELLEDCSKILELYRRNQDSYTEFLNLMNTMCGDKLHSCDIIMQVLQSISNIIEILFGLNIKALTESWKVFWNIVEKYHETLAEQRVYCIQEIEVLLHQIQSYLDMALKTEEDKQKLQCIKLSGFLLKIAVKIFDRFWDYIPLYHFDAVDKFLCSILVYSSEFLVESNMELEMRQTIQYCLCDVLMSFVDEHITEDIIRKHVSHPAIPKHRFIGCMALDMKILNYIKNQPLNSVDSALFTMLSEHIFGDITKYAAENCHDSKLTFYNEVCLEMFQCIIKHGALYNEDFENLLMSNILGNNIFSHIFAVELWIQIVRVLTINERNELVAGLIENIEKLRIGITFNSSRLMLLTRFLQRLFSILSDVEKVHVIKTYNPQDNIALWRLIGCEYICSGSKIFIDPFIKLVLSRMENIEFNASCEDFIETVEALKLLSTADSSILSGNNDVLLNTIQRLWELNYDEIDRNNSFLKVFIWKLCQATMGFSQQLSNDQLFLILNKMKVLSTTVFFNLCLCHLLNALSKRRVQQNSEQTKLNFLISDLFEVLLKESNDMIRKRSLKVFKQFSHNNQYIIVNNVSRMLPDMNLEKCLRNIEVDSDFRSYFQVAKIEDFTHVCLMTDQKKLNLLRENSIENENTERTGIALQRKNMNCGTLGPANIKRIKLNDPTEDVSENEDCVDEILQRIKAEVKCLNKLLTKERLTPKNARDIKMLACQLQNTLGPC